LRPIAEGLVDVDEELITAVPRDRLSIMTIHQAKGLEFPLVIVDISSAFLRNHPKNAAFRYPSKLSNVSCLEDDLAAFTAVGPARIARAALDRTFDDLIRLYYVAYSRPQTALLLVGSEKTIATGSTVKTVASGWRRDGSWAWNDPSGPRNTFANNLPLVLL
jgi:DNA helicase-2/ATP-dependent DNA helicase PcrA